MKSLLDLIFMIQLICSKISLEIIREVNSEIFSGVNQDKEYSILNPIFGYLFVTSSCLENFRLYGSDINPTYQNIDATNIFGIRDYSNDKGTIPFTNLLTILFPSPLGRLSAIRSITENFTKRYFNQIDMPTNLKALCDTFIKVFDNVKYADVRRGGYIGAQKILFENMLMTRNETYSEETRDIKLLTIHAYFIEVFDTKDHYREYLNIIVDSLKDKNPRILNLDDKEKQEFEKLYVPMSSFPYSELNRPVSNGSISEITKTATGFDYHATNFFSDCTETTILHICNCLFFDEDTEKYSLDHLNLDPSSPITNFYKFVENKVFTITDDIRNEWSKVVQCLELPKIEYKKQGKNEIRSGILNIMWTIAFICNSNKNNIYESFQKALKENGSSASKILDTMKSLFQSIAIPGLEVNLKVAKDIKTTHITIRTELIGEINIFLKNTKFSCPIETNMLLKVHERHSEVNFISRNDNKDRFLILDKLKIDSMVNTQQESHIIEYLIIRYISIIKNDNREIYTPNSLFNILYNSGPLDTNDKKPNHLIYLYEQIKNYQRNPRIRSQIIKVCENIVKSVIFTDEDTKKTFEPFFLLHYKYYYR